MFKENTVILKNKQDYLKYKVKQKKKSNCSQPYEIIFYEKRSCFDSTPIFLTITTIIVIFIICICSYAFYENFGKENWIETKVKYKLSPVECRLINYSERFDCNPEPNANEKSCEARGCCWSAPNITNDGQILTNVPKCYYPRNFSHYEYVPGSRKIIFKKITSSPYRDNMPEVEVISAHLNQLVVNVQIVPHNSFPNRYRTPFPEIYRNKKSLDGNRLRVSVSSSSFGFTVYETQNNRVIFDTINTGCFIFADQFLQISARLNANHTLFGIGERRGKLKIDTSVWQKFVLFNADQPPIENSNLYGSHPFYLATEPSGFSYGVFFLNSNAMEIIIQPLPAITFRSLGGIFEFFFVAGSSPQEAIAEYHKIIGLPIMPPLWGLGFHLCRYGTKTLNDTRNIFLRNFYSGIPIDAQWNDLDYMLNNNDFTYDKERFADLPKFIKELKNLSVHWIPIVDAGISANEPIHSYFPFDLGVQNDIFVKNISNNLFIGKLWSRHLTVWPDFSNSNTSSYWYILFKKMYKKLKFSGVWLDMNEPANFLTGSTNGCPNSSLETPPYWPKVNGGVLQSKTFCMTAKHNISVHYNIHNIYGSLETKVTNEVLSYLGHLRPFIISRSSFPGFGHFAGHWSGDVYSEWHDLKRSVSELLAFSLFGIPLMGADICGFNGNTTQELCARWYQLGAFYPFCRTHNTDDAIAQDPTALGHLVFISAKKSLLIRYSLVSYLYTLFYFANKEGSTVARPLFVEFPNDRNTYDIDEQFLWGRALMIIPVLEKGALQVKGYLPQDLWYDYYNGTLYNSTGQYFTFDAPADTIPLLIRSNNIIVKQEPKLTTTATRNSDIELLIALNSEEEAEGEAYFDSEIKIENFKSINGILFTMQMNKTQLIVNHDNELFSECLKLHKIIVFGRKTKPRKVLYNGKTLFFDYIENAQFLTINTRKICLSSLRIDLKCTI